ncbi:MAG: SDR family oxidoreductase [Hyphomicrobiales bacterium]|nr:SDR family oxidoreductase [Hyphomicrobiales bacterium]
MKIEELFGVGGKSAVVTGGASGFGFAAGRALAMNGARVTLIDVNADSLAAAQETLSAEGLQVDTAVADVTDKAAIQAAVDEAAARYGGIDILFANAGISGGPGFLQTDGSRNPATQIEHQSNELWEKVWDINVLGIVKTIQSAVPHMKAQGQGRIVVTSSCSATKTEIFVGSGYVISKAALGHLVRQLAHELAAFNITVNAISPGPAATNIAGGRMKEPEAAKLFSRYIPMHRVAQPEDVVGALLFFASPASAYVTGAEILVDGGAVLGIAD